MKICIECNSQFKITAIIDGKKRNLKNRSRCLDCQPFKTSIYTTKSKFSYAESQKRWYWKKKLADGVDPISVKRTTVKRTIIALVDSQCQICGYNKCQRNLAFHHIRDKKLSLTSRTFQFSMKKLIPELEKCVVVCHNCHGEIHDNIIDEKFVIMANSLFREKLKVLKSEGV